MSRRLREPGGQALHHGRDAGHHGHHGDRNLQQPGVRDLGEAQGKGVRGGQKVTGIRPLGRQGHHTAVHGDAEFRQQAPDLGTGVEPPHAEGNRGDLETAFHRRHQVGKLVPQDFPGQPLGGHRFGAGQIHKRRGVPGMQVGADFSAVAIPPGGQHPAGSPVLGHRISDQEGQGQAELLGDKSQALQGRDVGHTRRRAGITARKQAFFFHVDGDYQFHFGFFGLFLKGLS